VTGVAAPSSRPPWTLPTGTVLFIALALFWGGVAVTRGVEHLGSDQQLNLVLVLKGADPSLFPSDLIFDGRDLQNEYIPLYIGFLRWAYRLTGDLTAGYKLLVVPLNLLFLFGAYAVFLRRCAIRWVAVILAIFASLPFPTLAGELFGIGPVQVITARAVFTGVFPFLFLAFCAWLTRPRRLILLFFILGLLANLHPVSGLFVAPMLALTYVLEQRGRLQAWGMAVAMGATTLLGAAPILWNQVHRLVAQGSAVSRAGDPLIARLVAQRMGYLLYPPHTLISILPRGLVDLLTLVIALAPAVILVVAWRRQGVVTSLTLHLAAVAVLAYILFPGAKLLILLLGLLCFLSQGGGEEREDRVVVYFAYAIFWVSVGGVIAIQALFYLLGRPVLFADMIRGVRFAPFAVFLLLASCIRRVDWSRLQRPAFIGCLVLALVTASWEARHIVRTYLRTRGDAAAADLAAVARWARQTTDVGDLFLFDSPAFRVLAQRSLAFATKDGAAAIYHRPDRAGVWEDRLKALRAAGADPVALWEAGRRYGAQYVVVPAEALGGVGLESRIRYQNATYAVLATGQARLSGSLGTRGGAS